MMWSGKRLCCLFLALIVWESANGLGVWQNRPATYWQSGGGSKGPGDQALSSPVQQDFGSFPSGIQTAVYDVGSAQPLSTSGSGGSAANVPGFLRQYTSSSDQNVLNQYSSLPQSQGGYTAQSSGTSGGMTWLSQSSTNQAVAPVFQSQLLSSPVSSAQGSSSQSLPSQQSSLQLASPGLVVSSPPLIFTSSVPGTQTQSSSPVTSSLGLTSDSTGTSPQASYSSQSAAAPSTLYGQSSSLYFPSQGQSAQTSFQSQTSTYKPVAPSQGSASQTVSFQQGSLLGSQSQGISLPQSFTASYVPGTQSQTSSPVAASLSVASDIPTTSQQASYGSQSATGTVYGQGVLTSQYGASADKPVFPSQGSASLYGSALQTPSQSAQTTFQSQTLPYKPVSTSQGSASQIVASQQSSSQLASASQGISFLPESFSASFFLAAQTQPSIPVTSSQSSASASSTASQQSSYSPQSAAGTGYAQQSVQNPSQFADSPYKPVVNIVDAYTAGPAQWYRVDPFRQTGQANQLFPSQASGSQGSQTAQSSFPSTPQTQSTSGSLGFGFQSQSAPASTVALTQGTSFAGASGQIAPLATTQQYSRDASQSTSFSATQAVSSQSAPGSTVALTQGAAQLPSFQVPSRVSTTSFSAASPSGSLSPGNQVASSSYTTTTQSQTAPSSFGFGFSSQSAAQLPSFQTSSGPATASVNSASPLASIPQPSRGAQSSVTWTSAVASGQVAPAASTQQYSRDASQSTSFSATPAVSSFPALTVSLTQNAVQVPSFQSPGRFSTTSFVAGPSGSVSPDNLVASSGSASTSLTQSSPGSTGFGLQSQTSPASTVALTQSASQLSSIQSPTGFSSPSVPVSQPVQGGQSSVTWRSSNVPSSLGQVDPLATTQQYSRDALQSTGFSSTLPSQVGGTSQTSGSYGSAFQSSATQLAGFDQYSPVSSATSGDYASAQSIPTNYGLVQGYSNQAFGVFGQQQPSLGSSFDLPTSAVQGGSSVSGDSLRFSSLERSGSTSYSFTQDLNKPVSRPATWRTQDQFSVKH